MKVDMAPMVDRLFHLLLVVIDPTAVAIATTGFINLINLRINLLNYNGWFVATRCAPLAIAMGPNFDD